MPKLSRIQTNMISATGGMFVASAISWYAMMPTDSGYSRLVDTTIEEIAWSIKMYCAIPKANRLSIREAIAEKTKIDGNKIEITCAGD